MGGISVRSNITCYFVKMPEKSERDKSKSRSSRDKTKERDKERKSKDTKDKSDKKEKSDRREKSERRERSERKDKSERNKSSLNVTQEDDDSHNIKQRKSRDKDEKRETDKLDNK